MRYDIRHDDHIWDNKLQVYVAIVDSATDIVLVVAMLNDGRLRLNDGTLKQDDGSSRLFYDGRVLGF